MSCDIWWAPVRHAMYSYQLYVVKVRVKKKVWYLITNEEVKTEAQAWDIFFAYRRRWQIETSFRYGKCELAMESPRLWVMENRLKLPSIVTLVYAFLLHLLEPLYRGDCPVRFTFKMPPNWKAISRSTGTALPSTMGDLSSLERQSPSSWKRFSSQFRDNSGSGFFHETKPFAKKFGMTHMSWDTSNRIKKTLRGYCQLICRNSVYCRVMRRKRLQSDERSGIFCS